MVLFEWKEQYNVNIKEIDKQHKRFAESLNELHEAMLTRKAKEIIDGILVGLADYASKHFSYEEGLMKEHGYPELDDQKQKHVAFIGKVNEFSEKHKSGHMMVSLEVMNFLRDWWKDHILGTDKKYSSFFNEKGVF
jgi:hemerythrin